MSWAEKGKDAEEGGHGGAKMSEGYHALEVIKCIREKKDGTKLESNKGPYLMVVYADETGAEATCNYWITEKAQWKLIKDMMRLGIDMDSFDERGVELVHFLDVSFAINELQGRTAPGYAELDGKYVNIEILSPADVPDKFKADCGLTEEPEPENPNGPGDWDGVDESDKNTTNDGKVPSPADGERSVADMEVPGDVDVPETEEPNADLPF